jgi:hypothetical protein
LCADRFTAADIVIGYARGSPKHRAIQDFGPNVAAYCNACRRAMD